MHAVVARSTSRSQNVQNIMFGPLLEVEMSQKCPPFGAKQISELKVQKIDGFGALLDVEMLKKCTPFWREAHFEGKSVKNK